MKTRIALSSSKMNWLVVGLVALQLVVKLTFELGKAMGTGNSAVAAVAIVFTIGWIAVIGLIVAGLEIGYWLGAVWGLLHFVGTIPLPLTEVCDHFAIAALVASHGLLISAACLAALLIHAQQQGASPFAGMSKADMAGFMLLCVSVVVRTLWITFREPVGATKAQAAMAGKGGIAELAASSLFFVIIPSMIALCIMIPGIVMQKRWAFISAAVFGAVHIILTLSVVLFQVNQSNGPIIVIAASLGMLIGGIWMMNTSANKLQMLRAGERDSAAEAIGLPVRES